MNQHIPITKPITTEEELNAISEVLESGMLAQEPSVEKFENDFSKYNNDKKSIAVSSSMVALDLALKTSGIKESDEVITSPCTFIATSNSILNQNAKPMFADIDEKNFNIKPEDITNENINYIVEIVNSLEAGK